MIIACLFFFFLSFSERFPFPIKLLQALTRYFVTRCLYTFVLPQQYTLNQPKIKLPVNLKKFDVFLFLTERMVHILFLEKCQFLCLFVCEINFMRGCSTCYLSSIFHISWIIGTFIPKAST